MQYLAAAFVQRTAKKVPPDFRLSTMVFDSVVARIGELPPELVGELVFIYRYLSELNEIPKTFVQYVSDRRAATEVSDPARIDLDREIQSCVDVFNSYVDKAITRANIVQPLLLQAAFPWWSPRRWKRRPSKRLSLEDAAAKVHNELEHRAAIAAGLRRSS